MSSSTDPLGIVGQLVSNKYRVLGYVAEGGFSVVYRAQHELWNAPVALKCFRIDDAVQGRQREELVENFLQEGQLMASLSTRCAAIAQARDVGTWTSPDGRLVPFLVLEWLEGRTLDAVLELEHASGTPARSLPEAMAILEPVAVALEFAHAENVAHRDMKPANIFVVGDPRAAGVATKVLDFGIAKVMNANGGQTGFRIRAFSPNYAAPEQFIANYGASGPWSDVYAMALVLLELMTANGPIFAGDDPVEIARLSANATKRPLPSALGLQLTSAVDQVFAYALAVSPRDRYPNMTAFWNALYATVFPGQLRGNAGVATSAGMSAPSSSSLMAAIAPAVSRPPGPMSAAAPRRSRAGLFAGLAAVAALAGGGAALAMSGALAPKKVEARASAVLNAPAAIASTFARAKTTCPAGMALVSGGTFFMGSDEGAPTLWSPAHKVHLDPYCIDLTEVTTARYMACVDGGKCARPPDVPEYPKTAGMTNEQHERTRGAYGELCNAGKAGREQHPINCLSWDMASTYCHEAGGRLPTEAEWEFAARGSDGRKFPWGDTPGDQTFMNAAGSEFNAWETAHGMTPTPVMFTADDGFVGTAPVGSFPKGKTRYGLVDMIGNVWEWTDDWYATYKPDEVTNPKGAPAGERKAIRGGGFNGGELLCLNPAFRYHQLATASSPGIGMRCVKTL